MTLKYYPIHFNSFGEMHIKIISFDLDLVRRVTNTAYTIKLYDRLNTWNYFNTENISSGFIVNNDDIFDTLEEAQEALIKRIFEWNTEHL